MRVSLSFVLLVLLALPLSAATGTFYLKGDPADQTNKIVNDVGSATFDQTPPTGAVPITQTGSPFTNEDFVGNGLGFYWTGPFSGTVSGVLDLNWYWNTPNAETIALGGAVQISVFADPDYTATNREQPERLIGRAIVPLTGLSAAPALINSVVPVSGTVQHTLLIQVVPQFVDSGEGLHVYYGATTTPSSFSFHDAPQRVPFPAAARGTGVAPRFASFTPSAAQLAAGLGTDAGEPSIGVNWNSGNVFFQSYTTTFRVAFNDSCPTSAGSTWTAKQSPITGTESFDPILYTDSKTGRTFVSQLILASTESASAFTDNDGDLWLPSHGAGIASGIDHQTLGGGPFHAPIPTGATYPNAVYYCAQDIALANCAVSLDGGLTYGPAVPIYTSQQCGGLHGHIKVGPDGTAYVPNKGCGGQQAVVVSENNGITWDVRKVPNSLAANSDPSVALSKGGRVYFAFADNDNKAVVAVSDDRGHNWYNVKDVGAMAGIENTVFSEMVAGDDNRAAFAFLGTRTKGSLQSRGFDGVWHLYVSTTYDGGNTWQTVNASPNDPVQRGPIWLKGGSEISRNLLDFNDATIDREGRVLIAYADGCTGACVQSPDAARGNAYQAVATIVRQAGGRRMFAQYDPPDPTAPGAPALTVARNGGIATLTWSQANDGGSAVTSYSVYRDEKLIATLSGSASRYVDGSGDAATAHTYRVAAKNAVGSSCGSNAATAAPSGSSCTLPGVTVVTDAAGDGTDAGHDIQSVSVAEPYYADGSKKVVFTMKVASLASLPASSEWRVVWDFPTTDSGQYYADMRTDPNSAVSFEYGTIALTDAVVTAVGTPSRIGDADADSSWASDGTIRIVLSASKIGSVVAGDLLGGINARTYVLAGEQATTSRAALDSTALGATYAVVGNAACAPPVTTCLEDDDARIAYSNGWHLVSDPNAGGGHFRLGAGKPSASLAFTVAAGQFGAVILKYATSPKGGSADVLLDGVTVGTVDFSGSGGTIKSPVFGASKRWGGLQAGQHTWELRGTSGTIYLDGLCLESSSSSASPAAGPGTTSSQTMTLAGLQDVVTQLVVPANADAISVVADASLPVRIVLVDPLGASLATADNSSGVAVINQPLTAGGIYLVRVASISGAPVEVWTAATPYVRR